MHTFHIVQLRPAIKQRQFGVEAQCLSTLQLYFLNIRFLFVWAFFKPLHLLNGTFHVLKGILAAGDWILPG